MKTWIGFLFLVSMFLAACHHHDHDHDHNHGDGHDHSSEAEHEGHAHDEENIISYTLVEGDIELFLEFKPFVIGGNNQFRAVLTDLTTFQALDAQLSVHIPGGSKIITKSPKKGVFGANLAFKKAGSLNLIFVIDENGKKTSIKLPNITVAQNDHDAFHVNYPNADEKGSINYQREDAWKHPFGIAQASIRPVGSIIHTSGTIAPSTTDLSSIVAKCDGVVTIRKKNITSGTAVRSGELLFSVTGKGIVEDELEMNFIKAQSNLERQKASLDRKKQLLDENIIGQKEYDQVLNQYELAEAEFNNIKKLFKKGSKRHLEIGRAHV